VLNLCQGTYTVNVNDLNNCVISRTFQIAPSTLTSGISFRDETCAGSCNGIAIHTVSGAGPTSAPSFSFSWSNGTSTSSSITGLCAGNYTGTVTDGNGCSASHPFSGAKPPLTLSLTAVPPPCNGQSAGSITSTITGAQGNISYNWSPTGVGANPVNLPPGIYTLTAVDDSLCQISSVVTITNPQQLQANLNTTNPSCNGVCNGLASVTASFAVGTPTVSWSHTTTAASLNDLCGQTPYSFTVTDANGCTDAGTFTLTNPSPINVTSSIFSPICGANNNGSITITATGGTTVAPAPGYTISWNPNVSSTFTATGLAAAIYTVNVLDNAGCTGSLVVPLSNSNGPTAPVTFTNLDCNNVCTGAASIGLITGGNSPYTTQWQLPSGATTTANPLANLCAGNYISQITDATQPTGCITFSTVTITQPASVSVASSLKLPTCNGICDGSISVTASGGTGAFTYSWSPSAPNTSVLTNLCANDYTLILGYNNVCTVSPITFSVPGQNSVTPVATVSNNLCFGDCNGNISLFVSTGNLPGPFTFNWSNGAFGAGPSSSTLSSLCSGMYSVLVTASNGCNNTFTYQISAPTQMSLASAVVQPSCNMCNGSATVSATGGNGGGFTYNWTTGAAGATQSALCAGIYQVLISDGTCAQTETVIINNSNGITGENFNIINERCGGDCDGSATVTAIGGTPPYTYNWINPASPTSTIGNLCGGTYLVQMTDFIGCLRSASVTINAAVSLTLNAFVTPPDCGPAPFNGSATAVTTGGTPGYTYLWLPGNLTTTAITGIGPGSYTVTVTDSSPGGGCALTRTIDVSNLTGPQITFTTTDIACFGNCSGAIAVAVTSPSNALPTYSWSNGMQAATVTSLCPGVITVTVTDGNTGCITVRSFTVVENPQLEVLAFKKGSGCTGGCTGEISLLPIGGSLPYTFSWFNLTNATNNIDSLCAGSYSSTIIDAKGCKTDTMITFIDPERLKLQSSFVNSSCSSVADGSGSVTAFGGTPGYRYLWRGPGSFTSAAVSISNVLAGNYSVSVRDTFNCAIDTVLRLSPTITLTANAGNDTTVCPGRSLTLSGLSSVGAVNYKWYQLPEQINAAASVATISVENAEGSYTFQLVVTASVQGCSATDTVFVNTFVPPFVDAGPSYTIPVFSSVAIGGNPTAYRNDSITWFPSAGLSDPTVLNPVASGTVETTYYVSIPFGRGCMASDSMRVVLYPEIVVHNGFTPNNDGKNELWIIDYIEQFPDNTVEIFNRWGEPLFYSKGYWIPFDGTYHGKPLPVGTYYYVIKLNHPAYPKAYTGPLTIFR
jgi:gliding motility-associated-like protein